MWPGLSLAPRVEVAAAVPDVTSLYFTVQKERASHLPRPTKAQASLGPHGPGHKPTRIPPWLGGGLTLLGLADQGHLGTCCCSMGSGMEAGGSRGPKMAEFLQPCPLGQHPWEEGLGGPPHHSRRGSPKQGCEPLGPHVPSPERASLPSAPAARHCVSRASVATGHAGFLSPICWSLYDLVDSQSCWGEEDHVSPPARIAPAGPTQRRKRPGERGLVGGRLAKGGLRGSPGAADSQALGRPLRPSPAQGEGQA